METDPYLMSSNNSLMARGDAFYRVSFCSWAGSSAERKESGLPWDSPSDVRVMWNGGKAARCYAVPISCRVRIGGTETISEQKIKAAFIEPMLLLPTRELPQSPEWTYELKLDGYRAIAIKTNGKVQLRSRNNKDFNTRYSSIVKALAPLPDETVVDGEIVALDDSGRPSFNALQNYSSTSASIVYFVFDVPILKGRELLSRPLYLRREALEEHVLSELSVPIRPYPELKADLSDVVDAVRSQGLEGIVAKKLNSVYEPGLRSGSWCKMRLNQTQEFVVGGYTVASGAVDAVIFGYYEDRKLLYAGRTRNGFTPHLREQFARQFQGLEISECPFTNLPEGSSGRWGQGLTADKMMDCHWIKPVLVGRFEFVEWTADQHLRHSRFLTLIPDTNPLDVRRKI
jgi:DNA ligase D-like protein (predicted ligase)